MPSTSTMATSAAATPPLLTTASSSDEGKVCGACGVLKSKDEYSKAQWNPKKKTRRCKDCVEQDLPFDDGNSSSSSSSSSSNRNDGNKENNIKSVTSKESNDAKTAWKAPPPVHVHVHVVDPKQPKNPPPLEPKSAPPPLVIDSSEMKGKETFSEKDEQVTKKPKGTQSNNETKEGKDPVLTIQAATKSSTDIATTTKSSGQEDAASNNNGQGEQQHQEQGQQTNSRETNESIEDLAVHWQPTTITPPRTNTTTTTTTTTRAVARNELRVAEDTSAPETRTRRGLSLSTYSLEIAFVALAMTTILIGFVVSDKRFFLATGFCTMALGFFKLYRLMGTATRRPSGEDEEQQQPQDPLREPLLSSSTSDPLQQVV